jgi:hypothetical protein
MKNLRRPVSRQSILLTTSQVTPSGATASGCIASRIGCRVERENVNNLAKRWAHADQNMKPVGCRCVINSHERSRKDIFN